MIAKLRRPVALLLVLLTLFSLVPFGFADDFPTIQSESGVDPPTGETAPIEEDAATEPPAETTEPLADASTAPTEAAAEETTQPPAEDSSEETIPEDAVLEGQLPDDLDADDRILDADTYASTQNSIMLFDYADNGDYTSRLNYQVSCTYQPNGSGTTRTAYIKNMGWHFARYGGVAHADEPLYCIEPWRNYGASTSGNSVDRDVTLYGSGSSTGSNVWYALPSARREAIGLILLYSNQQWNHSVSVTTTKRDSNPNVPLRVATQMLIYEIVCGLRDPYSFNRNSTNECGTAGDVFYNAGAASLSGFTTCYNNLVWAIQAAKPIPSFCGSSSGSAPTIQLSGDSGSAYDSNGVLPNFSFSNGNGASFSKSGNTLYITKTGNISESTVFTATRYIPSASNSSYNIWYMSGSSYQTTISLYNAGSGSLNGYFKIKAPSLGNISLVKQTNTGANLSGWKIGLYYDAACTKPVSGSPSTTGADGTVTVSGLQPGTLYAKEIPTSDSYWSFDTAVKTVTIQANQTASVTFTNTHYGRIQFQKTTNTGNHLGGWTFRVKDSAGKTVGDYTTDDSGYAITGNLPLGRYTVVELPTEDTYWAGELGFHDVTVRGGQNTVDTWLNREQGLVWVYKKTNTGQSVEGWHITIYSDTDCTQEVGTLVTNAEGKAGHYFSPGTYYAKETGDDQGRFQDEYWMVDETVQKIEILPHQDTEITFTNVQYGKLKIQKTVEGDGSLAGWQFRVTDAHGAEIEGSPFTSGDDGTILTANLLPGEYTVEELLPEGSLYQCKSDNPQTVAVIQGQTAEVSFVNAIRTGAIAIEKVDLEENHLAGATFLLEWSEDGVLWQPVAFSETAVRGGCSSTGLANGQLTTNENGSLIFSNLYPGLHYRLTEVKAPEGFSLLQNAAFEGVLGIDNLELHLRVVNVRSYMLPKTGSMGLRLYPFFAALPTAVCSIGIVLSLIRKRKA